MCLAVEILMTAAGVLVLIFGKLYLSSELRLSGGRARFAGLILALPLPAILAIGFGLGIFRGLGLALPSAETYIAVFEYIIFFSAPVAVVLFVFFSKPRAQSPFSRPGAPNGQAQADLAEARRWLDLGYDGLAATSCEAALRANPRCLEAGELLSEVHIRRGDWEAAARALQSALQLDPRCAANHYRAAQAYTHLGKTAQAVRELRITLQLDPAHPQAAGDLRALQPQPSQGDIS